IVVEVGDGERVGYGEATYLNGYTDETIEWGWQSVKEIVSLLAGGSIFAGRERLAALFAQAPFTVSAFGTALDMLEGNARLRVEAETRVPLLALLPGETEEAIARDIDAAIGKGYHTLKIKVGFDAKEDLARMQTIQGLNRGRCMLRLDANQGYSRQDAVRFASSLDPDSIELFEQPCAKEDWDSAVAVARVSTVPMMLDESIYDRGDIERAAELQAARFIKLKLVKAGFVDTLVRDLARIRELGMEPVLGNGVATEISNWMEACAARGLVTNALESNGFLKPKRSIVRAPLRFAQGAIVLEPGWMPQLDRDAVEAQTTAVAAA
ncbi:MAG: mandelate racemase/muconate lactonizing enzyme family protein, partial [Vulcanimicrobiaceae bacterium]